MLPKKPEERPAQSSKLSAQKYLQQSGPEESGFLRDEGDVEYFLFPFPAKPFHSRAEWAGEKS